MSFFALIFFIHKKDNIFKKYDMYYFSWNIQTKLYQQQIKLPDNIQSYRIKHF